ncbi:hypothetical protein GCM10009670_25350 [Citricoccus alkalitolerans]
MLLWAFLLWPVTVLGYRVVGGAVLPEVTDGNLRSQVLFLVLSPLRPNAELWFLWALIVFFSLGRLVWRLPPWLVLGAAVGVSVLWSGVVQPAIGPDQRDSLGTGLYGFPQYFVLFIGAALFGSRDRSAPPSRRRAGRARWLVAGVVLAPLVHVGRHTLEVYLSHTVFIVAVACLLHVADVEVSDWSAPVVVAVVAPMVIWLGLLVGRAGAGTWILEAPETFRHLLSGRAGQVNTGTGPGR